MGLVLDFIGVYTETGFWSFVFWFPSWFYSYVNLWGFSIRFYDLWLLLN